MVIGGLVKQSLIDYEGKISAVIFTRGCNFRCGYCHNPELVLPEVFCRYKPVDEDQFFLWLKKRKDWLDAVVITGGEPTIHNDLPQFLKKIKEVGYLLKLDTNGSNPSMLESILSDKLVDYVAMDIKTIPEQAAYSQVTGVKIDSDGIDKIKHSILLLQNSDIKVEFRTTILPGVHNPEVLGFIQNMIKPGIVFSIQEYRDGSTINDYLQLSV